MAIDSARTRASETDNAKKKITAPRTRASERAVLQNSHARVRAKANCQKNALARVRAQIHTGDVNINYTAA